MATATLGQELGRFQDAKSYQEQEGQRARTSPQDEDDEEEYFDGDEGDDDWDEGDYGVYETMDDTPNKIQEGLFISGFLAEQNKEKLKKAGITHVLQVADGMTPSHRDDFQYMNVSVQDAPGEDLGAHFCKAFEFISSALEKKGGVLVHCVAGISRSSTICIGYLMWQHKICYDEAFRRVHAVRPWISPNVGFQKQLKQFQEQGCDPSAWRAWRHTHKEDPAAVVSLATLGLTIPPPNTNTITKRTSLQVDDAPTSFSDL